MEEYYTTEQVAKMLGIKNVITVRRWILKRQITAIKIGKEYRITKSDLDKFLEDRKTQAERKKP
ncbi:MAG: helix-turn-helix domain-containing protein [Candidatus Levybacteria bacterium]|nr:helix-turn-helix domain-containing protein [Candidatus Levybacteria bacterium]